MINLHYIKDQDWEVRLEEIEGQGVLAHLQYHRPSKMAFIDSVIQINDAVKGLGYDWCCFYTPLPKLVETVCKAAGLTPERIPDIMGNAVYIVETV
jgi:hypothetical protein